MSRHDSVSETSTILPSPDFSQEREHLADYNRDVPVSLPSFFRNVRRCKALLGPGLALVMGLEIVQMAITPSYTGNTWSKSERLMFLEEQWTNIAGMATSGLMLLTYFLSLVYPVKPPYTLVEPLPHIKLHRFLCLFTFILLLISLVAHSVPFILYIIITHLPAPDFYPIIIPSTPWITIPRLRNISILLTLLVAGKMRRGPKLRYTPLKLGTGFGVNAEKDNATVMETATSAMSASAGITDDLEVLGKKYEDVGEESNVIDYQNSAMLDLIFLTYISSLAKTSIAKPRLLLSDLPQIEEHVRRSGEGQVVSNKSGRITLEDEKDYVTRWTLVKSVWGGYGKTISFTLILETLTTLLGFMQAMSLYEIIHSLDDPDRLSNAYPYLMCWGLFGGQVLECMFQAYTWTRENYLLQMPVRYAISSILFTKILRSSDAKSKEAHNLEKDETRIRKGKSQVVNLLTIDSIQIASMATRVWAISNAMISLCLGTYLLYGMFGVSAFIGIAVVPLSTPLSFYVSRTTYRCDRAWAQARDARTSAVKEFLLGYKVIKLNNFEPYFKARIDHLRNVECGWQRWRYTLGTLFNILADQLPSLAIAITFLFYTKVYGNVLHPATAYVAINIFNRVKNALQAIPQIMQSSFEMLVAIDRICRFLNQPDVQPVHDDEISDSLNFVDATVTWPSGVLEADEAARMFRLRDVNVEIPKGKFTLICGPLGSGKTLMLRTLLGESVVEKGRVNAPTSAPDETPLNGYAMGTRWTLETWLDDSVAYAPQQAYVRHGTIKDNILFGQPFWKTRYQEALRQASLMSDLALLGDGDLTEVGEHGVTLSGGQRARINLARCLYSRAKTVYMDDILSAVDAHTAQFIFEECLTGTLLRNRTVILVTHHVALCLPGADYIVTLRDGYVEQACPAYDAKVDHLVTLEDEPPVEDPPKNANKVDEPGPGDDNPQAVTRQVYTTEHTSVGRVATSHYKMVFAAAGGKWYWLGIAFVYGGNAVMNAIKPVFMRGWSGDPNPDHLDHYLKNWFLLIFLTITFGGLRWVWLYGVHNVGFYSRGSKVIHRKLLDRICDAPLSFYESVPTGRIINIFAQDMFRLDGQVADAFGRTTSVMLNVGSSALLACFEAPPLFAIVVLFGIPMRWVSQRLGKLRADLRRLTAVANSPLISLYSDAAEGIVMIRAFGSHEFMMASMQTLFNRDRQATCADWQVYNWVRSLIRGCASVFVAGAGFLMVGSGLSGSQVGLVLTFATATSGGLFQLLEQTTNLEQTFVSAERINYYVSMDDQEPKDGLKPDEKWPQEGKVEFKEMSVRYAEDLPEVLHKVSFTVEPGMRVGLVGSTGSGKSTLALTLFRAMEPHSGGIEIDGIRISDVEMHELRKRLNMVVQDGSLCSGTLRDALDITGEKVDAEIYEALRRVHLIPEIISEDDLQHNPFTNLDTFVAMEGANFSQGQRQLLCLARALLKKSRILVMDEATSSVDFEMDAKITATIKEAFQGTTMIVIAHRLATIMQYDRVLVLDKGRVLEYDRPINLIRNEESAFHKLCMAQGQEEFDKLLEIADA